jgi:hypothetical protein
LLLLDPALPNHVLFQAAVQALGKGAGFSTGSFPRRSTLIVKGLDEGIERIHVYELARLGARGGLLHGGRHGERLNGGGWPTLAGVRRHWNAQVARVNGFWYS